jgi:hypothetical protein
MTAEQSGNRMAFQAAHTTAPDLKNPRLFLDMPYNLLFYIDIIS